MINYFIRLFREKFEKHDIIIVHQCTRYTNCDLQFETEEDYILTDNNKLALFNKANEEYRLSLEFKNFEYLEGDDSLSLMYEDGTLVVLSFV